MENRRPERALMRRHECVGLVDDDILHWPPEDRRIIANRPCGCRDEILREKDVRKADREKRPEPFPLVTQNATEDFMSLGRNPERDPGVTLPIARAFFPGSVTCNLTVTRNHDCCRAVEWERAHKGALDEKLPIGHISLPGFEFRWAPE
jgi:hypothetical protein